MKKSITLNCRDPKKNEYNTYAEGDFSFRLYRKENEPQSANRLEVKTGELVAELQPSKGLSLGQAVYRGKKIFWDAPYALPDPDQLDLWSDEVLINGKAVEAFTFLKTFAGGIEFYGLKNWGMPHKDKQSGELFPLHGETSNIPVNKVKIVIDEGWVEVEAEFIYHDMKSADNHPWYEDGHELYSVKKNYKFRADDAPQIIVRDTIKNISDQTLTPDWGYHVTFYPQPGSKILVPSGSVEERNGEKIPNDIETWNMAGSDEPRQETGIIHKRLDTIREKGKERCRVLLQHPDGEGIILKFPPSPYFQTWSCKGGAGSDEFMLRSGKSLHENNWDGLGIEIGSSALDHNQNIDESVEYQERLAPGEEKTIEMEVLYVNAVSTLEIASKINFYNQNRKQQ